MTPPDKLIIARSGFKMILSHVREGIPNEVCGILAGVGGVVQEVFMVPNTSSDPSTQFVMERQTLLDVLLAIEDRGWELSAIYHSHPPGGRSDLSPTDIDQAHYPDALNMICVPSRTDHDIICRVFQIVTGQTVEVPLMILE